jgi:hypothetical protein
MTNHKRIIPVLIFKLLVITCSFSHAQIQQSVVVFDGNELFLQSGGDSIHVGSILRGTPLGLTIRIINNSNSFFHISNVRGSCGLSVPSWPRQGIPPGGESVLQIRYDSGRPGRIDRNVTIHSNAQSPGTILRIVGDVVPAI